MSATPEETAVLIVAAKAGSKEALGKLLEKFRPHLNVQARQHFAPEIKAKVGESELVQETLLAALKRFPDFRGCSEEQIVGWLTRILIHRASHLKRQFTGTGKRDIKREKPILNKFTHDRGPIQEDKTTPDEKDEAELMRRTFHLLPPDYQEIVRLHHQQGKTFSEAAEAMNRSVEAAKKLWTRALLYWRIEMERLAGGSRKVHQGANGGQ